ncbi:MAG: hypothetical protein P4M00_14615 [Azospirillaceae bacterium]|nr:hypothetical protein [Azospirillaceae bacterium]
MLTAVSLVRHTSRPVKAHLSLDTGVLATLAGEGRRRELTRSASVENLTRCLAAGLL